MAGTGGGGDAERRRLAGGGEPLRPRRLDRLTVEGEDGDGGTTNPWGARSRVSDLARSPRGPRACMPAKGPAETVRLRLRVALAVVDASRDSTGGDAGRGRMCLRRTGGEGRETARRSGEGVGAGE
jgi:hypothetical protein